MKKILEIFTVAMLVMTAFGAWAADEEDADVANCKLVVQTRFASGKKRVQVLDTHAVDRNDCRAQAKERELSSDEDGATIKARFSWRPRG